MKVRRVITDTKSRRISTWVKILVISFLLNDLGHAQVFPVNVTTQVSPPYSAYLSDYTSEGSQNFMVQVVMRDVNVMDYSCRLRLTIEGAGITLRTKETFMPRPLVLQGGVPQILFGADLYEYFHPAALDFSGMSRSDYNNTARLPEGIYKFSVEVLDYNRRTLVSNKGTSVAWIVLNDPPLLNLPANFSTLQYNPSPNILFSWTPRHSASPNAAFTTEYIFRLVELPSENINPSQAFLTLRALFETVVTESQLLYGLTEPALLPGRRYAWQVEARDVKRRDLFKNQGRSEVFVFHYGKALAIPGGLRMRWAKPTTLAIQWDPIPHDTEVRYRLQYRPRRRSDNHEWYETWTRFTDKTLYHLRPDTEYEMKIRSEDALQESEYSEARIFRTLREETAQFVCKENVAPPALPENTQPIFPLSVNDTLHAGGYDVLVRDVMKDQNRYYGSGLAIVPWFNGAKVRVTFEKIAVNDQFWLTSGTIKTVWNSKGNFLIEEQTPTAPGKAPKTGELDITIVAVDSVVSIKGAAIASLSKDENGNVIITTTDGKEQTIASNKSIAVVDETGNGYVVDEKGNIAKTTAGEASAAASRGDRDYNLVFKFSKGRGKWGFDQKNHEALSQYYQPLEDGTHAAWKALSSAEPDIVEGTLTSQKQIHPAQITFSAGGSPLTPTATEGKKLTLSISGTVGGVEEELLALFTPVDTVPPKVLGKLNLVTYNPIYHNIQIIPVNDASLPGGLDEALISEGLNEVYNQAVVKWNVTVTKPLVVPLNDQFDDGEDATHSVYTSDMKKVLHAHGRLQPNTYYLFVIKEPRTPTTLGYMPRSRQAGFIFADPHNGNSREFLKTIAHELGHGAFNLKHTFAEHNLPAGATDNLMDYSQGTALYKYQWDYIHEPQNVISLFQSGEERAAVVTDSQIFMEQAVPLLQESSYREWLEKLRYVYQFLQACREESWQSYNGKGIIPYCFWRDADIAPRLHYGGTDVPFTAGLIDGGYVELEGFYHLPEVLHDLTRLPGKVMYAYTIAYWECRPEKLMAKMEDYESVVQELARMESEGGIWNWVKGHIHDYEEQKEELVKYAVDCRDAEDLRNTLDDLYDLATNWQEIETLSGQVYGKLKTYWDTLRTSDNHGRYEQGYLIIPSASVLLPLGVGIASKVEKLKTALRTLREASEDKLKKLVKEVVARSGAHPEVASAAIADLLPPVGKFRQLVGKNSRAYRAADFWKQNEPQFRLFTSNDGKYLIKHDPATGRMLFADLEAKKFIGFALDEDKLIAGGYEELLQNLKTVHGLPGGLRQLTVKGTTISLSGEKANVFLGKYKPNNTPGVTGEIGTDDIINELSILKNYSFADEGFELRPGSVHVLNIPEEMAAVDDFFGAYNKAFLDLLIRNNGRARLVMVSDPRKAALLKVYRNGIETVDPSGFTKEIRYLRDRGVHTVILTDGTVINLREIDLSGFNWTSWRY